MPSKKGRNYYIMTEEITEAEAKDVLRQMAEGKQSIYAIFAKVINEKQPTTKVGNLNENELGVSKLPLRTYLELALFCKEIVGDDDFAEYFKKMGAIQTDTSLSKDGFLMKLLVTMKKELADVSPKTKKENKGWFRKNKTEEPS